MSIVCINSLKFYTVSFYCMPSWELLQIPYFYCGDKAVAFTSYKTFWKTKSGRELVSLLHILHDFWRNMFLLLHSDQILLTGCLYFVRYWAIFQHNSWMVVFSTRCFFMVAFQDFILKKFICWTFPLIFRPKFLYDYYYYFSLRVFFHNHSRITELQGKGEGISLTPHYHFHPLHRHLDISRTITADGWDAGWGLRRGVLEESEDFQSSWLSNVKFKRIHSPLFSHSHSKRKIVWI